MNQLLEENNVDILGICCQMRYDRGGMIQTAEQYQFIHEALALFERSLPDQSAFLWINVGITLLGLRVSVTQPVNSQKNLSKAFVWGYLGRAGDPATSSPTTHTPIRSSTDLFILRVIRHDGHLLTRRHNCKHETLCHNRYGVYDDV
ncbi:unnamed protein product, partial [Timema podura]|nr:unnamed protein product [Timema podura]